MPPIIYSFYPIPESRGQPGVRAFENTPPLLVALTPRSPFLLTSVKDPLQIPPGRSHPFLPLPMVAGYPPCTGGWQPALPDDPRHRRGCPGAPPAQILNSRPMWVSRLSSDTWSFCTGITYLSSEGPPPLRHANLWPPGPANAHTYRITGFHTRSILLLSNPRPAPLLFCSSMEVHRSLAGVLDVLSWVPVAEPLALRGTTVTHG
jgi:hypothetical protein